MIALPFAAFNYPIGYGPWFEWHTSLAKALGLPRKAVGWAGFGFWIALPHVRLKPTGYGLWLVWHDELWDGPDLDSGMPCPCLGSKPIGYGLWLLATISCGMG